MRKGKTMTKKIRQYRYEPVGLDIFDARPHQPKRGTLVVKCSGGMGAPKNGTMGHSFVKDAVTGEFYGLVLNNSLKPAGLVSTSR
jgi:hypothetical protein